MTLADELVAVTVEAADRREQPVEVTLALPADVAAAPAQLAAVLVRAFRPANELHPVRAVDVGTGAALWPPQRPDAPRGSKP